MNVRKLKSFITSFLLIISAQFALAQTGIDTLFTIDGVPTRTDEFLWAFNKNKEIVQAATGDVESYVDTYINYKLKVLQAYELGLDKDASYKNELKGYEDELARNYLNQRVITDESLKEAYSRLKKVVNVDHILLRLENNASPQDTLEAFKKMQQIRKGITADNFNRIGDSLNDGFHIISEKLGYFSVFKMVYAFENAAYNTRAGEVSQIFRTSFGYHILKVNEVRDNPGLLRIARIFLEDSPGTEQEMNVLYDELQNGKDFSALARRYSDEGGDTDEGGDLQVVGMDFSYSDMFKRKCFELKPGEFSKPFKDEYGWQLIKLIESYPVKSYEEELPQLRDALMKDDRSLQITDTYLNNLMRQYRIEEFDDARNNLFREVRKSIAQGSMKTPEDESLLEQTLLSINGKKIRNQEFYDYIYALQNGFRSAGSAGLTEKAYKDFKRMQVLRYHREHLEDENKDYAYTIQEYRDGLLLFNLMQQKVWEKATDSTDLLRYFDEHRDKYQWKDRAKVMMLLCSEESEALKGKDVLSGSAHLQEAGEKMDSVISGSFILKESIVSSDESWLPQDDGECVTGKISVINNGTDDYVVLKIEECLPAGLKSYREARGELLADYQDYLDQQWIKELRKAHHVEVNTEALKNIKNKLN